MEIIKITSWNEWKNTTEWATMDYIDAGETIDDVIKRFVKNNGYEPARAWVYYDGRVRIERTDEG